MSTALARRRRYPLKTIALAAILLLGALALPLPTTAAADTDIFPEFPSLQANVDFWETIYSRYTTRQGVLHDSRDLSRIYAVIDLRPTTEARNRKHNRQIIKAAKARWADRLRELANGGGSDSWPDPALARRLQAELTPKALRTAANQVRCQIGQADRFREGLIRSGAYLEQIRAIFTRAGLPTDLAFLPHVESSFNLKAYSKFGAAGIWQFTRSTGRRFMQIGYTVDERRDPIVASHAAAKLLSENHTKLGSWPLAITAYNHGAAGMARAKKRHSSFPEIVARYKSRSFKFASRNFYAEFLAARRVASDPERYFGKLVLDTPETIHRVTLDNFAAVEQVADHFGLDVDTLARYNPALRPPVFRGQKYIPRGYALNLPDRGLRQPVDGDLELPKRLYYAKQKPSRFYTVQPGDTAGRIARLHGIRLGDLILANNLDRRATIYVNQNLRLPQPGEKAVLLAAAPQAKAAPARRTVAKTDTPPPAGQPEPAAPAPVVLAAASPTSDETVSASETAPTALASGDAALPAAPAQAAASAAAAPKAAIAAAPAPSASGPEVDLPAERPLLATLIPEPFPVTIGHLAEPEIAAVTGEMVSIVGEVVRREAAPEPAPYDMWMFSADSAGGPAADDAGPEEEPRDTPRGLNLAMVTGHLKVERTGEVDGIQVGYIVVEVEETLGHFADWLEIRTRDLRRINGLSYGQVLHTHQRIIVPFKKTSRENFEERRFEYHQRIQEDFFAAFQVESLNSYRVKSGDSLWTLADEVFAVPMWLLKRCNPEVDFGALRPRQELRIPVVEKLPDQAVRAPPPAAGIIRLSRTAGPALPGAGPSG